MVTELAAVKRLRELGVEHRNTLTLAFRIDSSMIVGPGTLSVGAYHPLGGTLIVNLGAGVGTDHTYLEASFRTSWKVASSPIHHTVLRLRNVASSGFRSSPFREVGAFHHTYAAVRRNYPNRHRIVKVVGMDLISGDLRDLSSSSDGVEPQTGCSTEAAGLTADGMVGLPRMF